MAAVSEITNNKANVFNAANSLFSSSSYLKPVNPKLSHSLLNLADDLLKALQDEDPSIDKYVELIADPEWRMKQFENESMTINTKPFLYLEIVTTELCNMQCKYCFENDYEKRPETLNQKVDMLIEKIDNLLESDWLKENFGGVHITYWGGEPTLNHEMIRKVCSYYKENDRVTFYIYSNGYNIENVKDIFIEMNKEKSRTLRHKFPVQISYDGSPIHDKMRLKGGKGTSDVVLKNIFELYENGVPLNLKSTVTPENFKYMPQVWDDFEKIYERMIKIDPNTNNQMFKYGPTIDYFNQYESWHLEDLEKAMIEIAKKEIAFYKKYNRFLSIWFDTTEKSFCTAGMTMTTIDVDGGLYYCHGCLYKTCDESKKNELRFGSIFEDDFIEKIKDNYENKFIQKTEFKSLECDDCDAIVCVRCNVLVYGRSTKETFRDKWYDFSNQKHLCNYFRLISKIVLATKKIAGGL